MHGTTIKIILLQLTIFFKSSSFMKAHFLGAFTKLRNATIKLCHVRPSVSLSVRIEQLGSHWTDFHKISYLSIFPKSGEEIQVLLKYDKNNGYFTCRLLHIYHTSLSSSYNEKRFEQRL